MVLEISNTKLRYAIMINGVIQCEIAHILPKYFRLPPSKTALICIESCSGIVLSNRDMAIM